MKFYLVFCFAFLASCSSIHEERRTFQDVTFELISSRRGVAVFEIKNISSEVLSYEHWFGQKGMPVAYCENDVGETHVCSKQVILLEDEYFTHETYIQPGDKVRFEVNVTDSKRVGVKFYIRKNGFEESFIWYQLKQNA